MRLYGFLKVRNEIVREGNLYRVLSQMEQICDGGVICDDASVDGTRAAILAWCDRQAAQGKSWLLFQIDPEDHDFRWEMHVKQDMLDRLHDVVQNSHLSVLMPRPDWILWQDGDELFSDEELVGFRRWLETEGEQADVWAFHYTQPWRVVSWARVDDGFDQGWFWKLWRYSPDLHFELADQLHSYQFPKNFLPQIMDAVRHGGSHGRARRAPQDILHVGNVGKNLVWKCVQYRNSGPLQDASMKRHLHFDARAQYRPVDPDRVPAVAHDLRAAGPAVVRAAAAVRNVVSKHGKTLLTSFLPAEPGSHMPFTEREQKLIEQMGDLKGREGLCVVIVPTYNRGELLPRTIASVLAQTYENWVCVVLDDGSTDDTPNVMRGLADSDPRIFYCRYESNRGGVAMNEIGMNLACEFGEFWVRLGSDDYFKPHKLELDVAAFRAVPGAGACWGPYRDLHNEVDERDLRGIPQNVNADARGSLLSHGFAASWANIAVRTSVLRQVRERHGEFCDKRIRNMEDWLVNARIAYLTEFVWRARLKDGRTIVASFLGESYKLAVALIGDLETIVHDGVWRIGADGVSQKNHLQAGIDSQLTMEVLNGSMRQFTPAPREEPFLRVL